MAEYEITYNFSNEGTRNEVRMRVVEMLSIEQPGTGNGDNATKYTYYVETLLSGDRVYLLIDLISKKESNPEMYNRLYLLLRRVYECHDVTDNEILDIEFSVGLPVAHILKTIKWLFIEQDIRYWNYSGGNMTLGIVPTP